MASFTDQIPQFNPYVSQQPVDAMVQVGMYKQQQYDTNLQKIQQSMSNIAGLQIGKDVDKQYLEKKMGEMNKQLNLYASSDLSSNKLTTHLRGMVGGIADDEIIQNSVRSTMAAQAAKKLQTKFNADGKGSPSNDYMLDRQLEKWYNDPKEGAVFSGTYKPYQEYNEPAREVIKNLAADYTENPVVFDTDENGNITGVRDAMTNTIIEGITPEKIQGALQAQLTPAMLEQMQMDGIYQYSGVPDDKFVESTRDRYTSIISSYENKITELQKMSDSSVPGVKEAIDKQIKGIEGYIKNVKGQFKSVNDQLSNGDLDGAKAKLFTIDWMDNMSQSFSSTKIKTTIEDNPYMKTQLTKAKMRQDATIEYAKMKQTDYWNEIDAGFKADKIALDRDKLALDRDIAAKEGKGDGTVGGQYGPLTLPTAGSTLNDKEYIKQTTESVESDAKETEKLTKEIIKVYNIDPDNIDAEIARAKDLSSGMSMDKRNDLNNLAAKLETTIQKQKQLLKLEQNAEKLHPTNTAKLIPEKDNKKFYFKGKDGESINVSTAEVIQKFKEFDKSYKGLTPAAIREGQASRDFTILASDGPDVVAQKKKNKVLLDAYTKRISGMYGQTTYNDGQFFDESGKEVSIYEVGDYANQVKHNINKDLTKNTVEKDKYIANGLKDRKAKFNAKGYPITLIDAKAKQAFKAGVLSPLALRAKSSSLEGVPATEEEIQVYSEKLSSAVVGSGGEGNRSITIYADDRTAGLTLNLTDKDFNDMFPDGRYNLSPQQEAYYNEYLPDLLDYVPPVTPVVGSNGNIIKDPNTGEPIYQDNPNNFWSTNTTGSYESELDTARYQRRDGYFNNIKLFDVSADLVTRSNPAEGETVIFKMNIQDPFTGKTYNSITFPSPVHSTRVDAYLKQEFTDVQIWRMLPGNENKVMTQDEFEKRINALKTGQK